MRKALSFLSVIGALLLFSTFFSPWISISADVPVIDVSAKASGSDLTNGKARVSIEGPNIDQSVRIGEGRKRMYPYLVLGAGAIALLGAIGILATGSKLSAVPVVLGGILAIAGGAWGYFDITNVLNQLPNIPRVSARVGYGVYLSLIGGFLTLVGSFGAGGSGGEAGGGGQEASRAIPRGSEREKARKKQEPSGDILSCPECGGSVKETDQFCSTCGAELVEGFNKGECLACGAPLEPEDKFCPNCGKEVKKGVETESVSKAWWILVILIPLWGGLIAWYVNKDTNAETAKHMLYGGILVLFVEMVISVALGTVM